MTEETTMAVKRPETHGAPITVPSDRHDLRILQSLRRVMRAVDLSSRRLFAQHAITGPQLVCLSAIVSRTRVTATELARDVFLSPSTVVGILDRLEQKGLITRARDGRDRRLVHVTATAAGTQLVDQAPCPLHERLAEGLRTLPEHEQAAIAGSMERLVAMLDASRIDAAPLLTGEWFDSGPAPAGEMSAASEPVNGRT